MPTLDPNVIDSCNHFSALIVLLAITVFAIWPVTIADIVRNDFRRDADKIVWFFFVLLVPLIGAFLYFLIGRFQKSDAGPAFRSTRYRDIGRE